ncbi:MAG: hypothetical protein CBD27_01330 [Rhodospirillaceae bacterium TMED167]|nr:hypothetical protein [Rhodospirillaceae bacterium]OUW30503.1 MAG: hypothetical protein CBD27_01330 [Rhodospirillaceae bacterium TMED167]
MPSTRNTAPVLQCAVSYEEWPAWRDQEDQMRLALGDTIELFSNCINLNRPLELTINWEGFKYRDLADCFNGGENIHAIHNLSKGIQELRARPDVELVPVLIKGPYARFRADRMDTVKGLPQDFLTLQWDGETTPFTATLKTGIAAYIEENFYGGETFVNVSGSEGYSLSETAYIMSQSKGHVGADSGMAHLASTVVGPTNVHVWDQEISRHGYHGKQQGWVHRVVTVEPEG